MPARRAIALGGLLACNPPVAGEPVVARPPDPPPSPAPRCDEPPAGALAVLAARACPSVLVEEAGGLVLRGLGPGAAALAVAPPETCRPCHFAGAITAAGPVLLAIRPSAGSELADAAWIGASGGGELVFAPLWHGQPDFGDRTVQGPAWALAPYVCGDALVLRPAPRLPGARAEEPPPALVRAAGVYTVHGGELARRDTPVPTDMSECEPVPLELP